VPDPRAAGEEVRRVELLLLLAVLLCPLVMGGAMVWMMRRMGSGTTGADHGRGEDSE
jgi:hypothetical protein